MDRWFNQSPAIICPFFFPKQFLAAPSQMVLFNKPSVHQVTSQDTLSVPGPQGPKEMRDNCMYLLGN